MADSESTSSARNIEEGPLSSFFVFRQTKSRGWISFLCSASPLLLALFYVFVLLSLLLCNVHIQDVKHAIERMVSERVISCSCLFLYLSSFAVSFSFRGPEERLISHFQRTLCERECVWPFGLCFFAEASVYCETIPLCCNTHRVPHFFFFFYNLSVFSLRIVPLHLSSPPLLLLLLFLPLIISRLLRRGYDRTETIVDPMPRPFGVSVDDLIERSREILFINALC